MMDFMRLDKIISASGAATRGEVKKLIKTGGITVDGVPALSAEAKYDPEKVNITVSGREIFYRKNRYIMMNKPAGYLSATEDSHDKTVTELLKGDDRNLGLFPAGRLDKDTEGLLLLTDDGDFCHRVTSPKKDVAKLYYAETEGPLSQKDAAAFAGGITLKDGTVCRPGTLEILESGEKSRVLVTITEGKYHQVKRMLASRGAAVTYLRRLAIGGVKLDEGLTPGEYRELTEEEKDLILGKN